MSKGSTLQALQEVRKAIAKVTSGVQSYTVDGQTFSYPQLFRLKEQERNLLRRLRPRVSAKPMGGLFS